MKCSVFGMIFRVLLLGLWCSLSLGDSCEVDLSPNEAHTLIIPPNEICRITCNNVKNSSRFIIAQLHSQIYNLSLSSTSSFTHSQTKLGTSVGIVTLLEDAQQNVSWFLKVNSTQNVTAVAFVQLYEDTDPLPGGCNQVFELEVDPTIRLNYHSHWTNVWFQWSNLATPKGKQYPDCEDKKVQSTLNYEVFISFMRQRDLSLNDFIDSVKGMLTVEDIEKNGVKAYSLSDGPSSKSILKVLSQSSQGAIYSIVVTQTDTGAKAAYITSVTYACDFINAECSVETAVSEIIAAIALAGSGLLLLFLGHRFFKTSQVVFGFAFSCTLVYILISLPHTIGNSVKLPVAISMGVIGGGIWLAVWYFLGFPIASVLLGGLCAGYLVSSALFFTPFGNIDWWESEFNYALCFTCVLLLFAVVFMAYPRVLSILSCGVLGAFTFLMCLAVPLRSSLALIFLNSIYHQTEEGYADVKVVAPFHAMDIILTLAWPVLLVIGIVFQFLRERGRPHFAIPVRKGRSRVLQQVPTRYNDYDDGEEEQSNSYDDDEQRRLILNTENEDSPPSYQSTMNTPSHDHRPERQKNLLT